MKWLSSISTSAFILLLSGIDHVVKAEEEEVAPSAKLPQEAKDKICSFMKKSQQDQLLVLSDFVKVHDEAEMKGKICAEASQREAMQKMLSESDVFSCVEEEMNVDVAMMAKDFLDTKDHCDDEIHIEVALIEDGGEGGRALRGGVHRELWVNWAASGIAVLVIWTIDQLRHRYGDYDVESLVYKNDDIFFY